MRYFTPLVLSTKRSLISTRTHGFDEEKAEDDSEHWLQAEQSCHPSSRQNSPTQHAQGVSECVGTGWGEMRASSDGLMDWRAVAACMHHVMLVNQYFDTPQQATAVRE